MSRRFLHRWLGHWGAMMGCWALVAGIWWAVAQSDLAFGAFVTALAALVLILIGWMFTGI